MPSPAGPSLPQLSFNGINGTTGEPLFTERATDLRQKIHHATPDPGHLEELRRWHVLKTQSHLDVCFDIDPRRLEQTGWGVVFPAGVRPEVREALEPLLALRQAQAAQVKEHYYRELEYLPGESKARFLARHGAGPGAADPENLPYYLLLVGDPEEIPYPFQYQLDVQYGVGRLCFDGAEDYARYAAAVVSAETGQVAARQRALLFGVANPGDEATQRSCSQLVEPLLHRLRSYARVALGDRWQIDGTLGAQATKSALTQALGDHPAPGLLFTASHGLGFAAGDPRQRQHQGALLCQDWPGPSRRGAIPADHYVSADDIPDSAQLSGMIAFHFACFGAGTPRDDSFELHLRGQRQRRAHRAFVARLPQRLLGHPRGGALAAIGHVDRAWSYSFDWPDAGPQVQVFTSALQSLLAGYPLGAAMEYFGQRYAELSSDLSDQLEAAEYGAEPDLLSLSGMWTARNDARSYVVLGDPAVRLPGAGTPEELWQP